jgi:hypothetical protein
MAEAQIGVSNANQGRRSAMCDASANTLAADSAATPRSAIITPSVGNGCVVLFIDCRITVPKGLQWNNPTACRCDYLPAAAA